MKNDFYGIAFVLCFCIGTPLTWMGMGYFNNGYAALAFVANFVLFIIFGMLCAENNDR